jgi:UDPglucose 6-dehydrogenase
MFKVRFFMKLGVIGLGYVGLITGLGFACSGYKVVGVDVDKEKVDKISIGISPIYENGLEEKLKECKGNFKVSSNLTALKDCNIIFICVGTPSKADGSIDLTYIKKSAEDLSELLDTYKVIAIKSTVVPGTTESIIPILEKSGKKAGRDFGLGMVPEFLREGNALEDFFNPDRIVIGAYDEKSREILSEVFKCFSQPKLQTNLKTAEMIKYSSNSFLATKISFINEIGNICKKLGIDTYEVSKGMGLDKRIGPHFLNSGIGFGGSCFPKDVNALIALADELGEEPKILKDVMKLNDNQPLRAVTLLKKHLPNLKGKTIGVLGLAFKANTDDVRYSRAIPVIEALLREGSAVKAHDPQAEGNFKSIFPDIAYCSPEEVLKSDAIIILTDWAGFEGLDYRGKIIIDGRGVFKAKEAEKYEGLCW